MLRRGVLLLPLGIAACASSSSEPETLAPLVTGYRHLTPLRLDVAEVVVVPPAPGVVRVDNPAPVRPDTEMARMAEERLVAAGTAGRARFTTRLAEFRREFLQTSSGVGSFFAGQPGERLTCRLSCRLEVATADERSGFIEAEARAQRSVPDGATPAQRTRAAEETVRRAMETLNVELEFQARRQLRAFLLQGAAPQPGSVEREDLPRS